MIIKCGDTIKKYTPESKYPHFDGTWEELEKLVLVSYKRYHFVDNDGNLVVVVNSEKFYTNIVKVDKNTTINYDFDSRFDGEFSYVSLTARNGKKIKANYVDIQLYSKNYLLNYENREVEYDWEIVSINASPFKCFNTLLHPITRARNNLNFKGGNNVNLNKMSKDQLKKMIIDMSDEIVFWNTHLQLGD